MSYDQRLLQPNRKTILIDADNTILAFNEHYKEYAYNFTKHNNLPSYDAIHALEKGNYSHNYWLDLFGSDFWATMPWAPWGKDLYDYCHKLAPVVVCTRPTNNASSSGGKHEWFNRNFKHRNWMICPAKWVCASPNTLLLDDNESLVEKYLQAGGPAILFKRENIETIKRQLHEFVLGI